MAEEQKKTVKIETLGCKLNFSETATISALLAKRGITPAQDGDVPSVCVVNTCSVTELADKKCRQHIRGLIKRYPDALMVVTGCYAQLKSQEIAAIDGVDIVLGSEQKLNIADYVDRWLEHHQKEVAVTPHKDIRQFSPSCERGDRTRYWLKVQDGCDYFCTYCTIPMARGRSRSGTIESLVAQAREVAAEGGKEIVITGVNIGDFGKNTGERFIDLLRAFDEVKEIERIRALIPDCYVGVDVMVGSRGETPEYFEESYRFIESLDMQHLHVFPYSERPGTMALRIPYIVPDKEKKERVARMMQLSDTQERRYIERYIGTVRPVLFEQPHGDAPMHGFTNNYIRVNIPPCEALVNRVADVRLLRICDDLSVDAEVITDFHSQTTTE